MTTLQTILMCSLYTIKFCSSILTLLGAIYSFIYVRRREKRELEQDERNKEYHVTRT